MINIFKALIPARFKRSFKEHLGVPSLHRSLLLLKQKGFNPDTALDIGAYEGEWSLEFLEVFPNARVMMVEGQRQKEKRLAELQQKHPQLDFVIQILSSEDDKEVEFREDETSSHVNMQSRAATDPQSLRKAGTLDTLLKNTPFESPAFLKLDVQGHELEVLRGAVKTLAFAEICLLEITTLDLGDESPLAAEVIQFMKERNFLMYDITQMMRRPYDNMLFQMDVMFIKEGSSFTSEKRWN